MNALVLEAIANSVSACTGSGLPISRRPQPRSSTTLPSLTTATATPGTSNCCRTRSTVASSCCSSTGIAASCASATCAATPIASTSPLPSHLFNAFSLGIDAGMPAFSRW